LRPGVFEGEDLATHEELSLKMKYSVFFIILGFGATTAFRVWQIKASNKDYWLGMAAILGSYLPAMTYYSYWRGKYNVFLADVSKRYSDKIKDDQLERFKHEGP
jgi:hypothetical protein